MAEELNVTNCPLSHNGPDSQLGGFCPKTAQIKMIKRLGQMFIPVSAL